MPDPFDELLADAEAACRAVAEESVEIVREGLRTPYPPVSKPGERPHRRTGELERSVRADVERDGDFVRVTVQATAPHAAYLTALGRDVLGDTDDLVDRAVERLQTRLNGNG